MVAGPNAGDRRKGGPRMTARDPIDIWRRPERSGVGPKPQHSRGQIAAAAIDIADRDGLAAVSVRRVARDMGTGPASLYRYLRSHDELIELMVDTVSGEYDLGPSGETPRDQLLALARQGRSIMHRHPWLAALLLTRPSMGPSTLRYLESALTAMESIDLPGPSKLQTVAMLTALTSAFVQNELSQPGNSGAANGAASDRVEYLSEAVRSGNYPRLASAFSGGNEPETPDDMFNGIIVGYLAGVGLRQLPQETPGAGEIQA